MMHSGSVWYSIFDSNHFVVDACMKYMIVAFIF